MKKVCISKDWYLLAPKCTEYKKIDLPNDYAITIPRDKNANGGASNGFFKGGIGKYIKYFTLDNSEHVILDIDGAYMCASVVFNEHFLTMHPHGYAPFTVDLTEDIRRGKTNKIEITTNALQPSSRWYSGAGLYRDVFLWTGGSTRIEPRDVFIKTPKTDTVHADVTVTSDTDRNITVECAITDADGNEVAKKAMPIFAISGKTFTNFAFNIDSPKLWEPGHPYLYNFTTTVYGDGEVLDVDRRRFGIRTVSADAKNGLLLNGKSIKLRGGCIHHDHGVLGAAEYPAACRRKLKKLQTAGFNAVRIAHNPPSLTLLELCDEMGIIVMDEFFDCWERLKGGSSNYHLWFADHYERDIESAVLRDRDHPCVISYSIGNEIPEAFGWTGAAEWVKTLVDCTKKYDNTRLVTSAVYVMRSPNAPTDPDDYKEYINEKYLDPKYPNTDDDRVGRGTNWAGRTEDYYAPLDICGYNYIYKRYETDHKLFPERVIWGSETHALDLYRSWGEVMRLPHVIGDFTWTAFDNLGEAGTGRYLWARDGVIDGISLGEYPWRSCYQGDFDLCGYRRPQSYFREAVWLGNTEPRIFTTHPEHYGEGFTGTKWHWYDVLDSWTFDDKYVGRPVKCEVYTDADEIEWVLCGKVIGRSVPCEAIATMDIPYQKGTLCAIAYKGGRECGRSSLTTVGTASRIAATPESGCIIADNRDLCYIDISIADANGQRVPDAVTEITCTVDGGTLMGIFSGDPKNEDQYGSNKCHTYEGRAVAIIRTDKKGDVQVNINADGLDSAKVTIRAK